MAALFHSICLQVEPEIDLVLCAFFFFWSCEYFFFSSYPSPTPTTPLPFLWLFFS